MDLFVMLMSMALAEMFRQINKKVQKTNVTLLNFLLTYISSNIDIFR